MKDEWLPILTAPAMRRLESLTLRDAAHNNGRARWAAIFSTSPGTLLLVLAAHCAARHTLRISPQQLNDNRASVLRTPMPSMDQLSELLVELAVPLLRRLR